MADPDAAIYEASREALVRYATTLVGPSSAEDVLSAVVVRVLARRRLSELDDPRAYLFRAVLNEARSSMRRPRHVALPEDIGDRLDFADNGHVVAAVLRLPLKQRAATYLVYWIGHSVAEAAALMGVRQGTVKRYLFDARRSLRRELS